MSTEPESNQESVDAFNRDLEKKNATFRMKLENGHLVKDPSWTGQQQTQTDAEDKPIKLAMTPETIAALNRTNEKVDHYKQLDSVFQSLKERAIKKLEESNIHLSQKQKDEITDITDIEAYNGVLNDLGRTKPSSNSKGLGGTTTIESQRASSRQADDGGYESYEEMVKDIHQKASDPDLAIRNEAKVVENQLWKKTMRALQTQNDKGIAPLEIKGKLQDAINEGDTKLQNEKKRLLELASRRGV